MVKETKFLLKQAAKAQRSADAENNDRASEQLVDLAEAFRAQAEVLKKKSKKSKKSKNK